MDDRGFDRAGRRDAGQHLADTRARHKLAEQRHLRAARRHSRLAQLFEAAGSPRKAERQRRLACRQLEAAERSHRAVTTTSELVR